MIALERNRTNQDGGNASYNNITSWENREKQERLGSEYIPGVKLVRRGKCAGQKL